MNRIILPVLLLLLIVSSCTVYKEYPIDVYTPGPVSIPPSAQNVTLVYRNFKYPADTLQHYYKNNYKLYKAKNDPQNLDSILAMACINELAKTLKTNNSFRQIRIIPYDVFKRHSSKKMPPFDFDLLKKLTGSSQNDLLISLETFSYFYAKYPGEYENRTSDEVITVAVWGVYYPDREKLIERKSMIDTLYWQGVDNQGNYVKNYKAPPRLTALRIGAQMAGENYAKRFSASWKTVNRIYSIPPLPAFSQAAAYFEDKKFDEAIDLWKSYADERNGKMAINARYNIALAYEIKDNLDLASRWLNAARDLAVKTRSREDLNRIFTYQKIIEKRKREINRLNQNQNE